MTAAVTPPPLRAGDTVALVAPSGPVQPEQVDAGVAVLESWGLRVRLARGLRARHARWPYLAGSDADRARDFQDAWCDPGIAAVFAARGGYGSQRMLDLVDWSALRTATPTWFVGASDATALHHAIAAHLGLVTLFASMPASAYFDPVATDHIRAALTDPTTVRRLRGPDAAPLVGGRAAGPIVGGTLSLIAASVGTPEYRPARGAIVVLEDVGEDVYRLDRMLTHLLRAGWFDHVAGIALGSWTGCGDDAAVRDLMLDRLGGLGVPMVWQLGFGHHEGSLALPLGATAELDADAATLVVGETGSLPRSRS